MTVARVVRRSDKSLKLGHIFRIGKIDNINRHIVSLKSLAKVLALLESFGERVAHESDHALPLLLVHAVLEAQLPNLHRSEKVTVPVDLHLPDGVDDGTDVIGLRQLDLNSKKSFWLMHKLNWARFLTCFRP